MRVLYLGPFNENMINYLVKCGEEVVQYEEKIFTSSDSILNKIDFIISYRYKYILPDSVATAFKLKIINLHISYLPWNKGADPNLWSFLEDTPKGVTIHYIDTGIDTGNIIAQKKLVFGDDDTLKGTYNTLCEEIEKLFFNQWELIKNCQVESRIQKGQGSYHNLSDKEKYLYLLDKGWDTLVVKLIGKAKETKG
jgi:methionyl-tRNA formyltransferase